MSESVKESMDVLVGATKIVNDFCDAKENDGSLSIFEEFKITLADAPVAVQAAIGAGKIPAELADLDLEEGKELAEQGMLLANAIMRLFALFRAA